MPLLLPVGLLYTEFNLRSLQKMTRRLVNNTADEFDELAKLAWREDSSVDDWQAYNKKEKELIKKAFADLAYIFDELNW